jgi:hypothetical protein
MEYKAVSLLPPVCKLLHVATQRKKTAREKRETETERHTHTYQNRIKTWKMAKQM